MHATTSSERPYFPYLLSNGNDAILINYTGAMLQNMAGHAHDEQNQSTHCAWYKASHRVLSNRVKPVISVGFNVSVNGEYNEISAYDQHFDAPTATLHTTATYWRNTVFDIETYLTQDGVLVEHVKLVSTNATALAFAVTLSAPIAHSAGYLSHDNTRIDKCDGGLAFTYDLDGNKGGGTMRCSRSDGVFCEPGYYRQCAIRYNNLTPEWEATFFVTCADEAEKAVENFAFIREKHLAYWEKYFASSSIALPDSTLQYAYELARYVVATAQHPSGAIHVGALPYLWNGGTCCPYDAEMIQRAMLMGNNAIEGMRHVQFYLDRFDAGCELAQSLGLKGFAISNWSDVFGNHKERDIKHELLFRKPLMIAIIGIEAATTRLYLGDEKDDCKKLALACAEFIESGFIRDNRHVIACAAGNESQIAVDRDSFMLLLCVNLFERCYDITQDTHFQILAQNLREELNINRNPNGTYIPFANADYSAGQLIHVDYYLPNLVTHSALKEMQKVITTPWGCDFDQPAEVYRHWPWIDCHLARAFARHEDSQEALKYLKHWFKYAASTGASPEKIRLDGFAIGYWYPTPYALYLQALYTSFAHIDSNGTIKLLYGFDGSWRDMEARNIRLPEGIIVSIKVKDGAVKTLEIHNNKARRPIAINPIYTK